MDSTKILTDQGTELDLSMDSPAFVGQQVTDAVRRYIAKEIATEFPALGPSGRGPIMNGFRKIFRKHKNSCRHHAKWSNKCSPALRSAASNGQWTQDRLVRAGLAECQLCKLCLKDKGTLLHRHRCQVTAEARGSCTPNAACATLVSKLRPEQRHLLETRALLAEVDLSQHKPTTEATFFWEIRPADGVIAATDTIYTDGSMIDGPDKILGRVGFGLMAFDEDGTVTAKAHGTPPSWIDSVPGAETWALCEALRNSAPGAAIWSDCLAVVKRLKSGRRAATASNVKLARLWHTIFNLCDTFSDPATQIRLEWMPAHTAKWQIGKTRKGDGAKLTEQDRAGNEAADELAKRGAKSHRVPYWKRAQVLLAETTALRAALQLGVTTLAANEHAELSTSADGTTKVTKMRDCEGDRKAKRQKAKPVTVESVDAGATVAKENRPNAAASEDGTLKTKATPSQGQAEKRLVQNSAPRKPVKRPLQLPPARVTPTKEYLCREAGKLVEAATTPIESFLQAQTSEAKIAASPAQEHSSFLDSVHTDDRAEQLVLRPKRAKVGSTTGRKEKQTAADICALLGSRALQH